MRVEIVQEPSGTWAVNSTMFYFENVTEKVSVGPVSGIPSKELAEQIVTAIKRAYNSGYADGDPGWED